MTIKTRTRTRAPRTRTPRTSPGKKSRTRCQKPVAKKRAHKKPLTQPVKADKSYSSLPAFSPRPARQRGTCACLPTVGTRTALVNSASVPASPNESSLSTESESDMDNSGADNSGLEKSTLIYVARETKRLLPMLLRHRPRITASTSKIYDPHFHSLELDRKYSPRWPHKAIISVVNATALDTALDMAKRHAKEDKHVHTECELRALQSGSDTEVSCSLDKSGRDGCSLGKSVTCLNPQREAPIAILNVTSAPGPDKDTAYRGSSGELFVDQLPDPVRPLGGDWLDGRMTTEEEELCFRSSIYQSFPTQEKPDQSSEEPRDKTPSWYLEKQLERKQYAPLAPGQIMYTPQVLVVRENRENRYKLMAEKGQKQKIARLPVVSAITVTASTWSQPVEGWDGCEVSEDFLTMKSVKSQMRKVLRIAASNGHQSIVLGTMGLGEKLNFRPEVAALWWFQVLQEREFSGRGWFREICFAVSSRWNGRSHFTPYNITLNRMQV